MQNYEDMLKLVLAERVAKQKTDAERVTELLGENTDVHFDGKPVYALNASLVLRQKLDASELRALKSLHAEKLKYFKLMKETDEPEQLREYAKQVEFIEFEMQKNWHFPQDASYHEWYRVPKCTCPKMDNEDRRGTEYKSIDPQCPIHGDGLAF